MKKVFGLISAIVMAFSVTTAAHADLGERPIAPIEKPPVVAFDLGERP
ncbi:hypothetical protein [Brevibacillus porteri]